MIRLADTLDTPTDEQRMIADSARAFFADARGVARARALRGSQPGYCPDTWREMAQLGWVGLRVPEAFGGRRVYRFRLGWRRHGALLCAGQCVRIDAENTVAVGQAAEHILQHVLEETRMGICAQLVGLMDAVLHRAADQLVQIEIARSVLLRNLALWETPLTSEQRELAASQTKARCVDAALAVTKSAIQMFGGMGYTDEVDVGLYLKRAMVLGAWLPLSRLTGWSARKQDGISFLLADMDTPGITIRRIVNLTGSAEFCEVFFDNVRVPRENLVGPLNGGWKMAKSLLGSERIMLGSPRLAKYPLNLLDAYAQANGLKEDPCFLMRYTQLELEVEDLGAAFIRMVEAMRRGQQLGAEISVLKLWVTETFQRVADLIFAVGEEVAASDETCVIDEHQRMHPANLFLAVRAATIYGGSSEIQRNILAKQILRLPNG